MPAISSGRYCFLIYYALYVLNRLTWVSENAQQAEEKLLMIMQEKEPGLMAKEVFNSKGYRSEHDAVHLMHKLSNQYEPAVFHFMQK